MMGWKRRGTVAVIAVAAALAAAGAARAQSSVTLCNNGDTDLQVLLLHQSAILYPLHSEWTASGWYEVPPGCARIVRSLGATEAFLSVAEIADGKAGILEFAMRSDRARRGTHSTGAERFFCVSDVAFSRRAEDLEDHETCPADYYLQLFNLYVAVDGGTDFTLDVN